MTVPRRGQTPRPALGPIAPGSDRLLAVVAGLAMGAAGAVWLTGQMASLIWRGRWPAVSASDVATIFGRLPASMGDPRRAWPPGVRSELPAAPGLYLVAVAVLAAAALVLGVTWRLLVAHRVAGWPATARLDRVRAQTIRNGARALAGGPGPRRHDAGAGWATRHDLTPLRVRHPGGGRLVLGRVGRGLIATEERHSALILGPTQSGKTTGLAIPALLEWDGPVVATSVKDDLVARTLAARATMGRTWVFDPTATAGVGARARWSPLVEAATWSGAQRVAAALVDATPATSGVSDGAFWFSAAAKLLAPMLLAAESGGRTMGDVVRWTNLQEYDEVERLLADAGEVDAALALYASAGRDERIRSSVYTTLETVLSPYQDPAVAASAERPDFRPAEMLAGRDTLYLCGPVHEQARVQAVFAALVSSVIVAATARSQQLGHPLDPPLLVVLDEAANIAPLKDLDKIASTAAGLGIQLVTVCQDLAQLSARYGADRARTIANNHRAKIVLSGVADVGTLEALSGLAGEAAVQEQSVTADRHEGRWSTTSSIVYRRVAPADELRRIRPGQGMLIYGHLPPAVLSLRPWYNDPRLSRLVRGAGPSTKSA